MELRCCGVSRTFLRKQGLGNVFYALRETELTLAPGTLTEITGRSGSGKSTLLNVMAGLLAPTTGTVRVAGVEPGASGERINRARVSDICEKPNEHGDRLVNDGAGYGSTEHAPRSDEQQSGNMGQIDLYAMDDRARARFRNRCLGIIPQGHSALQSLNVLENVLLPVLMYAGEKRPELRNGFGAAKNDISERAAWEQRAVELLDHLQIGSLKEAFPGELSGGELRRMAIARALMMRPGIILADEPTGDLDDDNTQIVLSTLRAAADQGAAVLLVTHEREAASYADRVLTMQDGVLH